MTADIEPFEFATTEEQKSYLIHRAARFFKRYATELDGLKNLLEVRLNQLALAYTLNNNLPRESVHVRSRVKTMESFLEKLTKKGWPYYYYLTEVAKDLVGARVVCWFRDDCYGMLNCLQGSEQFDLRADSLEDYIKDPKASGYRSIHILADLEYDRVIKGTDGTRSIGTDKFVCEIQLRTKLQDAWGEFTHEMHYKFGEQLDADYEVLVSESANRLASEDRQAVAIRNILQRLEGHDAKHEGMKDDDSEPSK